MMQPAKQSGKWVVSRRVFLRSAVAGGSRVFVLRSRPSVAPQPAACAVWHRHGLPLCRRRACGHAILSRIAGQVDRVRGPDERREGRFPHRVGRFQGSEPAGRRRQDPRAPSEHRGGVSTVSRDDGITSSATTTWTASRSRSSCRTWRIPASRRAAATTPSTSEGLHCIVLDANYRPDGSDYDHGNFDWTERQYPGRRARLAPAGPGRVLWWRGGLRPPAA